MKKALSVLLVFVMVLALAACGKKEEPQPADNKTTEAPASTKAAEPTKEAEPTPEPTKEVTPEPTQEVTPEPTQEVTPEPTAEPDPEPIDDPEPDDNNNYYGGDYGDGFGAEFMLEDQEFVDVIASTYYGVYCQSADDPMEGFFYPYYGDEMSLETMDEFNAAFLSLGIEEDQGQLCFLEKGMNDDVSWTLGNDEFGTYIYLDDPYTGEVYKGRYYMDLENGRLFVQVRIGEYDLWMTNDTRLISYSSDSYKLDEDTALRAIENYLAEYNESMYEMLKNEEYGVADGVYTTEDETIVVWLRTYTGAYVNYYIDPLSGETYVTETSPLTENTVETPLDETLNAWEYVD